MESKVKAKFTMCFAVVDYLETSIPLLLLFFANKKKDSFKNKIKQSLETLLLFWLHSFWFCLKLMLNL